MQIVGAGPAGLACAIRFGQLLEDAPELAERLGEVPLAVLEKGKQPGSHLLSGAVINPRGLRRLFRGRPQADEFPSFGEVHGEAVYVLSRSSAVRIPPPPTMRNHGNVVVSLSQLGRWLGEQAEEVGATILPETAATKLLVDHGTVRGVRTGDRGRGREGQELGNFEPGSDIVAKVTVLAEGTQGYLTGAAVDQFGLAGQNPQVYALGVKEVWKVAKPLDRVIHTMGWPLRTSAPLPRVRRLVDLSARRGHGLARVRGRPRLPGPRALRPRPPAGAEDATSSCGRSSRAASGSNGGRRRSRKAASSRSRGSCMRQGCSSAGTGPGWSTCRR